MRTVNDADLDSGAKDLKENLYPMIPTKIRIALRTCRIMTFHKREIKALIKRSNNGTKNNHKGTIWNKLATHQDLSGQNGDKTNNAKATT